MHPKESAIKHGKYDETENERDLSADAVGEHAHTGSAYHEAHQALGYDRTRHNRVQVPFLDDVGHDVREDLRVIAVEDKGQDPEN